MCFLPTQLQESRGNARLLQIFTLFLLCVLLCSCTPSTPFSNKTTKAWKKEFSAQYPDIKVSISKAYPSIRIHFTAKNFNIDDLEDILQLVEELINDPAMIESIFSSFNYTEEDINSAPHISVGFDYDNDKVFDAQYNYYYKDGVFQ